LDPDKEQRERLDWKEMGKELEMGKGKKDQNKRVDEEQKGDVLVRATEKG
jgi:hypothetical protein